MADLPKAGVQLVAENATQFAGDLSQASRAVNSFSSTTTTAAGQTRGASEIMTGALRQVGTIAVDAFVKAGRAVVGFVSDSINVAGDFESGMNKFAAVAGGALQESGLALKDFRDQFIQIGKELPVSTSEVQQAAIEMVKGGIEPATIAAGGLRQVIQFAAAADLNLEQAATISAKALGGWTDMAATAEEKAAFLTHSTDLLAKAANASTVNVDDLALGLYNVQGTAKLAGVSFDETVTALAQLAPSFSSSADAGTSFKTFLARLQPTTAPAIAAMEELGLQTFNAQKAMAALPQLNLDPSRQSVEEMMQAVYELGKSTGMTDKEANALVSQFNSSVFYDAKGNFVGMAEASRLLQEATEDLTPAQRELALQTIFGQDAIRTAAVFSEQGATGFNNMTAALEKQNSVQEMAAQKQAGFNTALENAKGSLEALQITLGSYLLPMLTELLNTYIVPGINQITAFAESIFSASDPIAALVASIDSVIPGFQTFADFLSETIPVAIDFLSQHLDAIKGALVAVGAVIAGAAVAGAIASLANPITLIVGAIAVLGAAWAEDWGGIRTTLTDFWESTGRPIFEEVVTWLGDNIPKAIKTVSDFWTGTLQPALSAVWSFLQANVLPILNVLVTTYLQAVEVELKILAGFWTDTLLPAIKGVWSFLSESVIPLFVAMANVQIAAFKLALRELSEIWNTVLLPAITAVYSFVKDNIIPIFTDTGSNATGLAGTIKNTLGPAFTWLNDNVLGPAVGWFDDISNAISGAIDWLNDLADTINNLPSLPDPFVGHSPPPIADWMTDIAYGAQLAASALSRVSNTVRSMPSGGSFDLSSGSSGFEVSPALVSTPASPAQIQAMPSAAGPTYNGQIGNTYNYSPTYAQTPRAPATDFALMQALATA